MTRFAIFFFVPNADAEPLLAEALVQSAVEVVPGTVGLTVSQFTVLCSGLMKLKDSDESQVLKLIEKHNSAKRRVDTRSGQ